MTGSRTFEQLTATIFLVLITAGCSTPASPPTKTPDTVDTLSLPRFDAAFSPRPVLPSIDDVHQLDAQAKADFLDYFEHPARHNVKPHRRVYDYLEDMTADFDFDRGTFTARITAEQGYGNCLSLAILTTALASLVNVPVEYQLAESDPVYTLSEDNVIKGVHLRTRLLDRDFEPAPGTWVIRRPGTLVDYFPSGQERFVANVSRDDYASRYYLNHAGDALAEGDLRLAYWHSLAALDVHPGSADAINNIAIIYRQSGRPAAAEAAYRYGLENSDAPVVLRRNFANLLRSQDRLQEAELVETTIRRQADSSPQPWYLAGVRALDAGNYDDAIRYLKKARELAPQAHQVYFALARGYAARGSMGAAKAQIRRAREVSRKPSVQAVYDQKLDTLSSR